VKAITNYITAVADFLEAELVALRKGAVKAAASVAMMISAGVIVVFGVGLFLAALFMWVNGPLGPIAAALITGGAALVVAVIIAEVGIWLAK
jgi:hypothetical protein